MNVYELHRVTKAQLFNRNKNKAYGQYPG